MVGVRRVADNPLENEHPLVIGLVETLLNELVIDALELTKGVDAHVHQQQHAFFKLVLVSN